MRWQKPVLFFVCLLPFGWLAVQAVGGGLGPDPAKSLVLFTGSWALNFLLVTLMVSPARQWLKRSGLIRYRRMLGLFAFFYASLHAFCVATYILGWDWAILQEELKERPYMLVGFLAWLTLVPLALTSNRFSVRRLGQRWMILHRLVYLTLSLALLHLFWLVRSDMAEALVYGAIGGVLLLWRLSNRPFFSRLDRKSADK